MSPPAYQAAPAPLREVQPDTRKLLCVLPIKDGVRTVQVPSELFVTTGGVMLTAFLGRADDEVHGNRRVRSVDDDR